MKLIPLGSLFRIVSFTTSLILLSHCEKEDADGGPVIHSFSPSLGLTGTEVTIDGNNFSTVVSANLVKFNDIPAALKSANKTQLVAIVPASATTGKISVMVNGRSATSVADFIIPQLPVIDSFLPINGTMGATLTITGSNFSATPADNVVMLNDLNAIVIHSTSTELQVAIPEGANTGKFTVTINGLSAESTAEFTVLDFTNLLTVRGLFVTFERRGWASEYWSGQVIQQFNDFDAIVGQTVAQEIAMQLDEMKKMGVNSITFELRSADSYLSAGPFSPPECNLGPPLGLQYPSPTQTEIENLVSFFDLVTTKQMKILLMLNNTHMEEQPPLNNATWLGTILNAIKDHPALELVVFGGDTHLVDKTGDGIGDACGTPAEAPLWLGPLSKPANYVKWAMQYAMDLGMPASKLTSEAVVGNYYVDIEGPAGPDATDSHLWKTIEVLKQIFDELSIPENQRVYGISFYEHRKCQTGKNTPCTDAGPHDWAEETLKQIFQTIGRKGSRVIAIEMGLLHADPEWTTEQAFESQFLLMKRYGVAGGCFWRWIFVSNDENGDPTLATPVKIRGAGFSYTPVKDIIAKYYLGN